MVASCATYTCFTWFTIIVVMVVLMVRPHSPMAHVIEIHWLAVTMMGLHILMSPSIRCSIILFIMVVSRMFVMVIGSCFFFELLKALCCRLSFVVLGRGPLF